MKQILSKSNDAISFSPQLEKATGSITYNMTNDYMFKAVLQKNQHVLKGLICSCLHLSPDQIKSIVITNPIPLGEAIDEKELILDIAVLLNDHTLLNLEMQVQNELNWPERSLIYLCRSFDQLQRGENYLDAKPAIHIGFLNFSLFKDHPEFYAKYQMLNVKNHRVYSDKLTLYVLELNQIKLATEEDKQYRIDHWASLFKATTWEEIKMIAKENEALTQAAETIFQLSAEETIRQRCQARQDYYRKQNTYQKMIADLTAENSSLTTEVQDLSAENSSLSAENSSLSAEVQDLSAQNEHLLELLRQNGISV